MEILVRRLNPEAILPDYKHFGDAGADLYSTDWVSLYPRGGRAAVGTGIAVAIPEGYVGLVHPRSGLAAKHAITVVNAPGTIDAGYRGEIKVLLINHDQDNAFAIQPGDRIAQLVIQKVESAQFIDTNDLGVTVRGEGGFGSTGR